MSTIGTLVNHGVTLGPVPSPGTYTSPLTVTAAGTVLGGSGDAVFGPGYASWTVANYGTVQSTGSIGVALVSGGTVLNEATGIILGRGAGPSPGQGGAGVILAQGGYIDNLGTIAAFDAVDIGGSAGTVVNSGTLQGGIGDGATFRYFGNGVLLQQGGTVTNSVGGYIAYGVVISDVGSQGATGIVVNAGMINARGGYYGVLFGGSGHTTGTVVDSGVISGYRQGIWLQAGGTVSVANTGYVGSTRSFEWVKITGAAGTVIDAGTILSHGQTAVSFGGTGDNRLVLDPGYHLHGVVIGSTAAGATNTLELGATATVGTIASALQTEFVNFGAVRIDAGASWSLTGGNTIAAGMTLTDYGVLTDLGTFTNAGDLDVSGGRLVFDPATLVNSGTITGTVTLGAGSYLVNTASGTISGATSAAVYGYAGPSTVHNAGSIGGGAEAVGIQLNPGGTVSNTGTVTGLTAIGASADATISNTGLLYGRQFGIILAYGGEVLNRGTIASGGLYGSSAVALSPGGGTVINYAGGLIADATGAAVDFGFGTGGVINFGTISGGSYGIVLGAGHGSVFNTGTITGANGVAIYFGRGYNHLTIAPGSVLNGIAEAHGTDNTLELASAASVGTIAGIGSNFINFSTVSIDVGATWVLSSADSIGAGLTLNNAGTLTGGTVTIAGGGYFDNSGRIAGTAGANGVGYNIGPGTGGTAVSVYDGGSAANSGVIAGGTGGAGSGAASNGIYFIGFGGGIGGTGIDAAMGAVVSNTGTVVGGSGGAGVPRGRGGVGGAGGTGIMLEGAGSLDNTGLIVGGAGAVGAYGYKVGGAGGHGGTGAVLIDADSIVNDGVIAGGAGGAGGAFGASGYGSEGGGAAGIGVVLDEGGSVVNGGIGDRSATIQGYSGISASGTAPATVTNFGNIYATGGNPANAAGVFLGPGSTVVNAGTIGSNIGPAVDFVAYGTVNGNSTLVLEPGYRLIGRAFAAGANNTVELAAGTPGSVGTVSQSPAGEFSGFQTITLDPGASWSFAGANAIAPGIILNDLGTLTYTGTLTNAGTIAIGGAGVLADPAATLINSGSISGTVTLSGGGYLDNTVSGNITAPTGNAVYGIGLPNTVVNAGTIASLSYGTASIGVNLTTGGTVVNFGTIIGSGGTAIAFSGNNNRLIDLPGAVFGGIVSAGGSGNLLELAAAGLVGTISGLNSNFVNFGTIAVDAGAFWLLVGSNTIAHGAVLDDAGDLVFGGTVINAGTISALGAAVFEGQGASLNNSGTILTTVTLNGTGTSGYLNNLASGLVTAPGTAVYGIGAPNTVTNAGTIQATGTGLPIGIYLKSGGVVTNLVSGLIQSDFALELQGGGLDTVNNYGTIQGAGSGYAIELGNGTVTNAVGGTIEGPAGIMFGNGPNNTLLNSGTIIATTFHSANLNNNGYPGGAGYVFNAAGAVIEGGEGIILTNGAGTLNNQGTISGSTGYAILLGSGGTITNGTQGVITGPNQGVYVQVAAGTVVNYGTISATGTTGIGVELTAGGTIANDGGGLITSTGNAAAINGGAGTILNYGTILSANHYGANVNSGVVNNGSSALIEGIGGVSTGSSTLLNAGTIVGTQFYGANLAGAAYVLNSATGLISGVEGGVILQGGVGTLVNQGTISGGTSSGAAVTAGGSVANYGVIISGSYGVHLANGGTVSNHAGATITGTAGRGVDAGFTSSASTVVNAGTISASGFGIYSEGNYLVVDNASSAAVIGVIGIRTYGSLTLTNAGTITGTQNEGVLAAGGTVNNSGLITSSTYSGVDLSGSGYLSNAPTGSISGSYGVAILNGAGTVSNAGTIVGKTFDGVFLQRGGYLANAGLIQGYVDGAATQYSPATVFNSGTIEANATAGYGVSVYSGILTNTGNGVVYGGKSAVVVRSGLGTVNNAGTLSGGSYRGVWLIAGGTVNNYASGVIAGNREGIYSDIGAEVVNAGGTVESSGGAGILLAAGGTVTNSGTIAGNIGVSLLHGYSTVVNSGTIIGTGGTAVSFVGTGNRLVVDPGAVFDGVVDKALSLNTLELAPGAAAGTLTGIGTNYTGFDALQVDSGATWLLSGSNYLSGALTNDGTLGIGSNLSVSGAVGNYGQIAIGNGAQLSLLGGDTGKGGIAFYGYGDLLRISPNPSSTPATVGNVISAFAPSDTVDLLGVAATGYSYFNQRLYLYASYTRVAYLNLTTSVGRPKFMLTADGTGGTDITVSANPAIGGTSGSGVVLTQNPVEILPGSYISNTSTAAVYGPAPTAWTVTNYGTLVGLGSGVDGLLLEAGGTLHNGSFSYRAVISGYVGVDIAGGVGDVVNFGMITGSGAANGIGVHLEAGGTVRNGYADPPVITGASGVVIDGGAGTVNNYSMITGTGSGPGADGVLLNAGGSVFNTYGTISGYVGVEINGAAGLVRNNRATIYGNVGPGVLLSDGGVVANNAGFGRTLIEGAGRGVEIDSAYGTVSNSGTIIGATDIGVELSYGGNVYNSSLVQGVGTGVKIDGAAGAVNNYGYGTIVGLGTAGYGVQMSAGGAVTNGSPVGQSQHSLIEGTRGGVEIDNVTASGVTAAVYNYGTIEGGGRGVILGAPGVVRNGGTIIASGGAGVYLGAGGSVNNENGKYSIGMITGATDGVYVTGGAGALTNSAIITGYGTAGGQGGVVFQGGGSVYNSVSGRITGANQGVFITGAAGTIDNRGSIASTGGYIGAVALGAGGTVINGVSGTGYGLISGHYNDTVFVVSGRATVINYGALLAGVDGAALLGGGLVENLQTGTAGGGVIMAGGDGVRFLNNAGTVINTGTINGTSGSSIGVYLDAGGSVINGQSGNTGALITVAGPFGVYVGHGSGTVTNFGSIASTTSFASAVELAGGGLVSNYGTIGSTTANGKAGVRLTGASATVFNAGVIVSTGNGVVGYANGNTVINAGTISGSGVNAVAFASTGNRIVDMPGAVFNGNVSGGYYSTLELAAGAGPGIVSGLGTGFTGFTTVQVDAGASWQLSGALESGPNGFAPAATLVNSGTVGVATAGIGVLVSSNSPRGGAVINNAGAVIQGAADGIAIQIAGVSVNNSGLIASSGYAIYASPGTTTTVTNFGTIITTAPDTPSGIQSAVRLRGGGVVTNAAGGLVSGADGVEVDGGGTVTNFGNVLATGSYGAGVFAEGLGVPLTVVNGSSGNTSATITGAVAVEDSYTPLTVVNYGTISAAINAGADIGVRFFFVGGRLDNKAGAQIVGGSNGVTDIGVVAYAGSTTVTNAGIITGGAGTAVSFSGNDNRLIADPGAVFGGIVNFGAGTGNVLELASGDAGTVSGLGGTLTNFIGNFGTFAAVGVGNIIVDPAASLLLAGTNSITPGSALVESSPFVNTGSLNVGGTLISLASLYNSGIIAVTGELIYSGTLVNTGTITVASGGVLEDPGTTVNRGSINGTVTLTGGSYLHNYPGAIITTAGTAVLGINTYPGLNTVANAGTITSIGGGGIGVDLTSGGVVTNQSTGYISGGAFPGYGGAGAVYIAGAPGTVLNFGTLVSQHYQGVKLAVGGFVANYGTIFAHYHGDIVIKGGAGAVNNSGVISNTGDDGVYLGAGGSVFNSAGATITGGGALHAVDVHGGTATVTNLGILVAGASQAVYLGDGGTVLNQAGTAGTGLISGGSAGVLALGAAATVVNSGRISSANPTSGIGVDLAAGGTVANQAGGLVTGTYDGVRVTGGAGTVVNLGNILGTGTFTDAVALFGGGLVVNGASGATSAQIGGAGRRGVFIYGGAGTVTNFGTIQNLSGAYVGVYLKSGGTVTNFQAGLISGAPGIDGIAIGHGAGTVTNYGAIGGIYLEAGGQVTNQSGGLISGPTNAVLVGGAAGTIVNFGAISGGPTAPAINLLAGGVVSNQAGGSIYSFVSGAASIRGGTGAVSNSGSIRSGGTFNDAVYLGAGGSVTNASGGRIIGAWVGVEGKNTPDTVVNSGTITSTSTFTQPGTLLGVSGSLFGVGVILSQGGTVINRAGGLISAYEIGVYLGGDAGIPSAGAVGFVQNYGVIASTGPGANAQRAVELASGGTITNFGTLESQGQNAVEIKGTVGGTIVNSGLIEDFTTAHGAIYISSGGVVINNTGATITSPRDAITFRDTAGPTVSFGTVVNAGNINSSSPNYATVYFQEGGIVTNLAGGVIGGARTGISFNDTLGTVISLGSVVNAGQIVSGGSSAGSGVYFGQGGALTNQAGGIIVASRNAVSVQTAAGTVVNYGQILSNGNYAGVRLAAGGSVTNQIGAAIFGGQFGIRVGGTTAGGAGTVSNSGAIFGGIGGAELNQSGQLYNNLGASVIAGTVGVALLGSPGAVGNDGVIAVGTTGFSAAVYLQAGGSVVNGAGGTLSGVYGVGGGGVLAAQLTNAGFTLSPATPTSMTVVNAGTITGFGGTAVAFGSANDVLVVTPGAVFNGLVSGGGGSNTIDLTVGSGVGVLNGIGSAFLGFGGVTVDRGATWQVSDSNANAPAFTNSGTINVANGTSLGVAAIGGTTIGPGLVSSGLVQVFGSGVAIFDGGVYSGQTLGFVGTGGTIVLSDFAGQYLQGFAGTISGLAVASGASPLNAVDLTGVGIGSVTGAVLSGNTITVLEGSAAVAVLGLATAPGAGVVAGFASDGAGGTDVFLTTGAASLAGTVTAVSGNEGSAIPLTIVATPSNPNDALSILITGVPADASLSAGTRNADGSYTLTAAQLPGLVLNAGETSGTLNIAVTDSIAGASTSGAVSFTVMAAAEAPSLSGTVAAVSGAENSGIPLTIVATPADGDDSLSINISGVPAGATLSAGTLNADGSYTLSPAQLGGLAVDAGMSGGVLHVVATSTEASSAVAATDISVAVSAVFDFIYTYPDGSDYYQGTVADNGTFGYHTGEVIGLPGGGTYTITGQAMGSTLAALPTTEAPGTVFVTNYSHGGFGAADPVPLKTAAGQSDGTAGLGSEADAVLGSDGVAHLFSPAVEVSFPVNQLYGFVFDYADGAAYYTGTVADDGTFGFGSLSDLNFAVVSQTSFSSTPTYAQVAAAGAAVIAIDSSGNVVGDYILFAEGQTTDAAGTVRMQAYVDGSSGSTFNLNSEAGSTAGLGTESGNFTLDGSSLTFSALQELIDPPPPPTPPVLSVAATAIYTGGQAPIVISPDLTLDDQDVGTIVSASVVLGADTFVGDGDLLSANTFGTAISASYDSATETLTLTGSDSIADYRQVLDSVTYSSTTADPTAGNAYPFRTVTWQATDTNGQTGSGMTTLLLNEPASGSAPTTATPSTPSASAPVATLDTMQPGDFADRGVNDTIWMGTDGSVRIYEITNGQVTAAPVVAQVGSDWSFAAVGHFFGAGAASDYMLERSDGTVELYQVQNDQVVGAGEIAVVGTDWVLVASGDFYQSGNDSLLMYRPTDGAYELYNVQGGQVVGASQLAMIGTDWTFAGTGNFYNNGTLDFLAEQQGTGALEMWQVQNGQIVAANQIGMVGGNEHVVGVGDFNNDGTSDILMESDTGTLRIYEVQNGQVTAAPIVAQVGTDWQPAGVGNFFGDGTDFLMRNGQNVELYHVQDYQVTGASLLASAGTNIHIAGAYFNHPV